MNALFRVSKTKNILLLVVLLAIFATSYLVYIQVTSAQATSSDVTTRRQQLEAELANLEKDIETQKKILTAKQRESVSLERDIAILDAEISKAKLSIKARTISIANLEEDIRDKGRYINKLSDKIDRESSSLAQLLRKTDEIDSATFPEILFTKKTVSDFFEDVVAFEALRTNLTDSINTVRVDKLTTEQEKKNLENKKSDESALRQVQELEKRKLEQNEAAKQQILKVTKGVEKEYQAVLKSKEKSAAAIRSELFMLQGSKAISFERALELANLAAVKTGIRPAFLLGIIAEESNLGQNVGTGTWTVDMKAPRDTVPFAKITASLGLDPNKMPVSKKPWYGYGGAMGPAQFIPSTWAMYAGYDAKNGYEYNSSKDLVGGLTGNQPPNPWDPEDAFMAAALYLTENGANKKTSRTEFIAAMCYLAGCGNVDNKKLHFYGDDVMCLSLKYQKNIDILEGTNIATERQGDIYHKQCL